MRLLAFPLCALLAASPARSAAAGKAAAAPAEAPEAAGPAQPASPAHAAEPASAAGPAPAAGPPQTGGAAGPGPGPDEPAPPGIRFSEGVWRGLAPKQREFVGKLFTNQLTLAGFLLDKRIERKDWDAMSPERRGEAVLVFLAKDAYRDAKRLADILFDQGRRRDGPVFWPDTEKADFMRRAFRFDADYPFPLFMEEALTREDEERWRPLCEELRKLRASILAEAAMAQSELNYRASHPSEVQAVQAIEAARASGLNSQALGRLFDNSRQGADAAAAGKAGFGPAGGGAGAGGQGRGLDAGAAPRLMDKPDLEYRKWSPRGFWEGLQRLTLVVTAKSDSFFHSAYSNLGGRARSEVQLLEEISRLQREFNARKTSEIARLRAQLALAREQKRTTQEIRDVENDLYKWLHSSPTILATTARLTEGTLGEAAECTVARNSQPCIALDPQFANAPAEENPLPAAQKVLVHELRHIADDLMPVKPAQKYIEPRAQLADARAFRDEGFPHGSLTAQFAGGHYRELIKDPVFRLHEHETVYDTQWNLNIGPDDINDPEAGLRWRLSLLYNLATNWRAVQKPGELSKALKRLEADRELARVLKEVWAERRIKEAVKVEAFIRRAASLSWSRGWAAAVRALSPEQKEHIRRGHADYFADVGRFKAGD